jgi:hypothetical protein
LLATATANLAQYGRQVRTGVDRFLTTLVSRRMLCWTRQTLVTVRQAKQTSLVTL